MANIVVHDQGTEEVSHKDLSELKAAANRVLDRKMRLLIAVHF